jgi:hypothetical protein
MFTKKTLVSALIAAGALGAVAIPLPSAAASFDFFFSNGNARQDYSRHDNSYGRRHDSSYGQRYHQPTRWDRDGDGIANRYDRTPNGEVRRMRDRDRDGVADRYDNYPNNRRWR